MAKTFKIPRGLYLTHRARADGTVVFRWGMAPKLRDKGIKAIDLVDGDGKPLTLKPAIKRAEELTAAMKAGREAPAAPRVLPAGTVGDLLDAFLDPRNLDVLVSPATGRKLSDATKRSYRDWRVALDEVFADEPVNGIDHQLVSDFFTVAREQRGWHMAYYAVALLKIVFRWAPREWRLADVEWKKVVAPEPPAKIRVGHPDELACLLLAMDNPEELYRRLAAEGRAVNGKHIPARPELGDSLVAAVWTTQRVGDVLRFTEDAVAGGRLRWIAQKNMEAAGRRALSMPLLGPLPARIEQAKARKAARKLTCPELIVDPELDAPYSQRRHGNHFREARDLAALFYPSLKGEGVDPWGASPPRFTFEDCRDTGITRLYDAGCDLLQICAISNHASPKSLMEVINSYIEISGRTADRAGEKMQAAWEANKWAV